MNKLAKYQWELVNLIISLLLFIYGAPIVCLALRWLQGFKDKIKALIKPSHTLEDSQTL